MWFFSKHFEFSDIPDLSGKVAIVTGSNTGIGKITALELARKNCTVVVACRDTGKGQDAVNDIKSETHNENVECIKLDLMSLKAVASFVETFKSKYDTLHILINNAAVMACPFSLSEDGLETQFATNHVGHYYLTMLLLSLIEKSGPSRIVNVSSMGHSITSVFGLDPDTINDEKSYQAHIQYGKTKSANILFTRELAKRLRAKGINNVYVNSNHPGTIDSDLYRHSYLGLIKSFLYSPEKGALTQLYLATSLDVEEKKISGQYYVPYAKSSQPNGFCQSDKNAKDLWDYTEELLKEKVSGYNGAGL